MAVYLIDFENVRSDGLRGIDSLSENDKVYLFYSANADTLTFEAHDWIMRSKAQIQKFKIVRGGKNSLDFQLSTYLGYLVRTEEEDKRFTIISKDHGFDYTLDFWTCLFTEHGAVINCAPCIREASNPRYMRKNAKSRTAEKLSETDSDSFTEEFEDSAHSEPVVPVNVDEATEAEIVSLLNGDSEPEEKNQRTRGNRRNHRRGRGGRNNASAVEESAESAVISEPGVVSEPKPSFDGMNPPEQDDEEQPFTSEEMKDEPNPASVVSEPVAEYDASGNREEMAESVALEAETVTESAPEPEQEQPVEKKKRGRKTSGTRKKTVKTEEKTGEKSEEKPEETAEEKKDDSFVRDEEVTDSSASSAEPQADETADKPAKGRSRRGRSGRSKTADKNQSDETETGNETGNVPDSEEPKKRSGNRAKHTDIVDKVRNMLKNSAKEGSPDVSACADQAAQFVIDANDKQDFYRRIIKMLGQKTGLEIYKVLRPEYTNLKRLVSV